MTVFRNERIWRYLTNFWTFILIVFLALDFTMKDGFSTLSPLFSVIYTGVLGIYVGTKEFDRWYDLHDSRHPGEIFIAVWTVFIVILFAAEMILRGPYKVPADAVADYVMVLTIFALTQKSKKLHAKRKKS
jgi:hypothetical protein